MKARSQIYIDAYSAQGDLLVLLKGCLVLDNCEIVRHRLLEFLRPEIDRLHIYIRELDYVDSAGWGAMVGLKMAAHRNKTTLRYLAPNDRIKDVFRISKLDSIFEVVEGHEAELTRDRLERPEFLLWRESPDESQRQFNTEAYFTPLPQDCGDANPANSTDEIERNRRITELSRQAIDYLRLNDYASVVETYLRILELEPDDISALNNLGVVYEKRPEWHVKALEAWMKVLKLSEEQDDLKHAQRARRHLEMLQQPKV